LIEAEEYAILLYIQQEGRGIGLVNKIKAYLLQDAGFDTYDANLHLSFEPDERDYEVSAAMIGKLGMISIRLLANNPDKVKPVRYYGIAVSPTVPLELPVQEFDEDYMRTKKERFGHQFKLEPDN